MDERRYTVRLKTPHDEQALFIRSKAKRKIIRAGRRGGKTFGVGIYAVENFLDGKRILYTAPTQDQLESFWIVVKRALQEPIDADVLYKNETRHIIEVPGTEQRIRAKTAWNADTLRGDYADILIFDEYQLTSEDAWNRVGAPMLLDNNGDATFIYTPPSLASRSTSKARDPQHAAKMFKMAEADTSGRWETFHFTSMDNPHISQEALADISQDMTSLAYRQEIKAEDIDEAPGALWNRALIEKFRVLKAPDYDRIVVGVDPSATSTGDEAGIVTVGVTDEEYYMIADDSLQGSPLQWARSAIIAYHKHKADRIIAESNNGGEMVKLTIHSVDPDVPVKLIHASRGKHTRAEPIAARYESGRCHHVGKFEALEDEMCLWVPGDTSPNRMDALVWAMTELALKKRARKATQHRGY